MAELEEVLVQTNKNTYRYYDIDAILNQNFLKSSRFCIQIPALSRSIVGADVSIPSEELSFLCDSVEFPGQSLTTSEYRMPGKLKLKIPYLRDLNEVTLTFYHNTKLPLYNIFSSWVNGASPSAAENLYFNQIVCPRIKIIQFADTVDETTNILRFALNKDTFLATGAHKKYMTVELLNAYPLNFASMPANWADDGFHKMSVTFFYENLNIDLGSINYKDIFKDLMKSGSIVDTPITNSRNSLDFFSTDNGTRNA